MSIDRIGGRVLFVPCLLLFLFLLICPVRAAEVGDSDPVDGIVDEDPAPADPEPDPEPEPEPDPVPDPEPEPEPDPGPPVIVLPVPTSLPMVTSAPDDEDFSGLDEDFFVDADLDGIALPEDTVDYTALMEVLSSINLFLAYIVVGVLIVVGVTFGKLVYSFFNMFF